MSAGAGSDVRRLGRSTRMARAARRGHACRGLAAHRVDHVLAARRRERLRGLGVLRLTVAATAATRQARYLWRIDLDRCSVSEAIQGRLGSRRRGDLRAHLMRSGLYILLFDELADPALVARLCAEAEEAGWHGVFVWDHVRWHEPVVEVADTQITLAAIASATERIRLGPMVTPLARRRPVKVARETATLDRLSN